MNSKTSFFVKHPHVDRFFSHRNFSPKKASNFFSSANFQKTLPIKKETLPAEIAPHFRDALNNLIVALQSERQNNLHARQQELIEQMTRRALFLNQGLTQGANEYSWFSYYAEKTLGEQLAQELLKLKSLIPTEWSGRMRGEVRAVSFSYFHYLDTQKRALEKELATICEDQVISPSPCP